MNSSEVRISFSRMRSRTLLCTISIPASFFAPPSAGSPILVPPRGTACNKAGSGPQEGKRLFEVLGQRRAQGQAAHRERKRMQHGPLEVEAAAVRPGEEQGAAVAGVAEERKAQLAQVDADLVGAARLGQGGDERGLGKTLQQPEA